MSTKVKYYQMNDTASMKEDMSWFAKFGYSISDTSQLEDRDVMAVTYERDDSIPENQALNELEQRYADAENAIRFRDAYENYDVKANVAKRVPFGQIVTSFLGILFCGLFVVFLGGIGFTMLFMPDKAEEFLATSSIHINSGGEEVLSRDFSIPLPEDRQIFGFQNVTWRGIGWLLFGIGGIFALGIAFIILLMIRSKLARIDHFNAEVRYFQRRLTLCNSAAEDATREIEYIDKKLAGA